MTLYCGIDLNGNHSVIDPEEVIEMGVNFIEDTIDEVKLDEHGDIAFLVTQDRGELEADYLIDCTGFRGPLIQ